MQSKGVLALWAVVTALVVGGLTFAVLAFLGGDDEPEASGVVVDEPVGAALDDLGSEGGADSPTVTPPPEVESVLAEDVGFYSVRAYSLTRINDLSMSIEKDDVLVTDGVYQAVLGPEIIEASEVYQVDVQDEEAADLSVGTTTVTDASWSVYTRFNDAAALKAATSDLGCHESPDNMIAMVKGTELLRLVALPTDYCGDGFTRGQIVWLTFYGSDGVASQDAEKTARDLAAALLGDETTGAEETG
ncbi:hypothetical protein [Sanguibacter sp. 25GB23B1]|uniref:hypothetical protein n=1 Tax=unclassified Sanguibacter TaxID=2645534 RepID=UPI0032AF1756